MSQSPRLPAEGGDGSSVAAGAGFAAGLLGIVASSCCVLPILLVGAGLGGIGATLIPTLAALRPYFLGAAVLAIAAAWVVHLRRSRVCATDAACAAPARSRRAPLWLVSVSAVVLLAIVWQATVEPWLLAWVR